MKITLTRKGALYLMEPWLPEIVPLLTYTKREFNFGGKASGGRKVKLTDVQLFSVQGNVGVFPSGLYPRVTNWLKNRNHEVVTVDKRDLKKLMPFPDFSKLQKLRVNQDRIIKAVAVNDGGLLVGATGLGKSFLIRQLCRIYPTLKIVITSPRRSVVNTIYDELTRDEIIPRYDVGKVGGGKYETDKRITVCTNKSILRAPIKECDLLLFDEVHAVGANKISEHLSYIQHARKFGFTATPEGRGDNAELEIEALFGPVLVTIDYTEAQANGLVTPIEVDMYRVTNDVYLDKDWSPVTKKRRGYWRNVERNNLIARIARQVPEDEQVLIMVETLEHAIYLHNMLPDFDVVSYGTSNSKKFINGTPTAKYKMNDKLSAWMRREFEAGRKKRVIATTVWREGVNFEKLAVLIRADAAVSKILSNQIPGRLSRLSEGKSRGLLIDFTDEFNDWGARRAQSRIRTYRKTGFKVSTKVL